MAAVALCSPQEGACFDRTVCQFQSRLKELGYDPGPIDGKWGPLTQKAVRTFQKDKGIHVTGDLDKGSRELLRAIDFSPYDLMRAITSRNGKEVTRMLLRLGFAAGMPMEDCDEGGTAQEIAEFLIDEEAFHIKPITEVRLSDGSRVDYIFTCENDFGGLSLLLVFGLEDRQWVYLGAVDVYAFDARSYEKTVLKDFDAWVLSVELHGSGTGISTTSVTQYLVARWGLEEMADYETEGYDVFSSIQPFIQYDRVKEPQIAKVGSQIEIFENFRYDFYLNSESGQIEEISPVFFLEGPLVLIYNIDKKSLSVNRSRSLFRGDSKRVYIAGAPGDLVVYFDLFKKEAKKAAVEKSKADRFKEFVEYFPDSPKKKELLDILKAERAF